MLTPDQYKEFGKKFVERFLANGFGAMTETEMDTLVFDLLSESEEIKDKSNYYVAKKLQISESKVKSLRLNAMKKYKQENYKTLLASLAIK
jgi:DNA-binding CsgD family transcriptional regulator